MEYALDNTPLDLKGYSALASHQCPLTADIPVAVSLMHTVTERLTVCHIINITSYLNNKF